MPFVVTGKCIKCRYTDCVEVCPVNCFYQGENMLVINPDECIDCGVCVPECPADAIFADNEKEATPEFLELNRKYSQIWPNMTNQIEPLPNADVENGKPNKILDFSANPHRD